MWGLLVANERSGGPGTAGATTASAFLVQAPARTHARCLAVVGLSMDTTATAQPFTSRGGECCFRRMSGIFTRECAVA